MGREKPNLISLFFGSWRRRRTRKERTKAEAIHSLSANGLVSVKQIAWLGYQLSKTFSVADLFCIFHPVPVSFLMLYSAIYYYYFYLLTMKHEFYFNVEQCSNAAIMNCLDCIKVHCRGNVFMQHDWNINLLLHIKPGHMKHKIFDSSSKPYPTSIHLPVFSRPTLNAKSKYTDVCPFCIITIQSM